MSASRKEEYPLQGRAPQTHAELVGTDKKRKAPAQTPVSNTLQQMRIKIQTEGLKPGTIVQCHNETTDKWYALVLIVVDFVFVLLSYFSLLMSSFLLLLIIFYDL